MSNVLISIASEFDNRAFKKAEASTNLLEKQAKKLGKTLLGAFSVHQVMQYSKASILAYTNDAKAAALLANQLKNLGLSYQAVNVEKFISDLQSATGILDDELRPAFSKLVRVTGSVAETQKLMTAAFDASRGAGIEYAEAIDIIAKAYVGNYRGIKQLNLGLSESEIKMMSFDELLNKITAHFKGAGAAAINSYAGKLDLLKVAAANAQETIGKGFVDAFTMIADDQNFQNLIKDIDNAALAVADMIRGVGVALDWVDSHTPSWLKKLLELGLKTYGPLQALQGLIGLGADARKKDAIGFGGSYYSKQAADKQAAAAAAKQAKSAAARLAAEKKITAEKRAQTAIDNANKALSSAKGMFDIEGIQIAAALQGNITEEQRKRLELMKMIWDLEQAIDAGNTSLIEKLTKQLEELTKQTAQLNANYAALAKINDIMNSIGYGRQLFDLNNLSAALNMLNSMTGSTYTPQNFASTVPQDLYKPLLFDFANAAAEQVVVPEVNITIDGSVSDLIDVVVDGLQNKSASGVDTRILRNTGGFNW